MNALSHPLVEEPGTALHLPAIEPHIAALRRAAFGGRSRLEFGFGGSTFKLHVSDVDAIPPDYVLALQFRVGSATGWLFVESFDIAGEEWAGIFSRLDPQLAQALFIEESAGLFTRLAKATGSMIQLVDMHAHFVPPRPALRQLLEIENGTNGIRTKVALCSDDPEIFEWLARELERIPRRLEPPPVAARLPVVICIGQILAFANELKNSQCGDVLLLTGQGRIDKLMGFCTSHRGVRLPFRVQIGGSTVSMTFIGEKTMNQKPNELRQPRQNIAELGDVPVPITVVMGEVEVPLRAMGNLQSGYVFELPASAEDAVVHLYTGGACVGQGRLVMVGNKLGVRLLEWGGKSDGESA